MSQRDEIDIEILADGTFSISTGAFSEEVHEKADEFLKDTFAQLGGTPAVTQHKPHDHKHGHSHVQQKVGNR